MNLKKSNYIKIALLLILLAGLFYSRFINLGWGFPYPFHPDERNMAVALQQLTCKEFSIFNFQFSIKNCFNPHFFAYGQFPLYLGYLLVQLYFLIIGRLGSVINLQEGVYSLRLISAFASILTVVYGLRIVDLIILKQSKAKSLFPRLARQGSIDNQNSKNYYPLSIIYYLIIFILFIFSPGLIQFAHFGTTESLLMLFYTAIVYFSLKIVDQSYKSRQNIVFLSLVSGLAIATKISALVYILIPALAIFLSPSQKRKGFGVNLLAKMGIKAKFFDYDFRKRIVVLFELVFLTAFFSLVFSPHNLINLNDFLGALSYESNVALGGIIPFYTRQFIQTVLFIFQFKYIFPYALGWPIFIFSILGFFILPFNKKINLLRLAFLIVFIPNGLFFAKWTRFMAPIFPIMIIFAILFLTENIVLYLKQSFHQLWIPVVVGILILFIIPGIGYLSVYQNKDVRFKASQWMDKNIPDKAHILSETANVVDLPIFPINKKNDKLIKSFSSISFNFYDLDENKELQKKLRDDLAKADYIIIPSRRIFMNNTCYQESLNSKVKTQKLKIWFSRLGFDNSRCLYFKKKYPLLNGYYQKLFSGQLDFVKVAEFSSYPKVSLFGKTLIEFPDEEAEETWSVFDHSVIRIYERKKLNKNFKF